ncbi:MAG TPA: pyridoxal phosphate-dependent aminotransferase [Deltaproteobacteria bacterium]|mgnify:FL=1|nr:pyridoxal phosphate-dependent aminotransferase [Deltaproteobacteria bacterium]
MGLYLSDRQEWVARSEIRNTSIECERGGGINLAQGVCDLEVPGEVRQGAHRAIEDGINVYTRFDGLRELREAIGRKYTASTGIEVDPESEVIASSGTTGAFYCAALALLNPGDEVIVFEPYYSYHISTLRAVGALPVYVRMSPPDWAVSEREIEQAMTPRCRALVLNTPANPSGKVFSRAELEMIAGLARAHDLFVFTDEIYEDFVYDGIRHIPPAVIEGMRERTVTTSGFSKIFSITGWRIGYCICDRKWARSIGFFNDLIYVCAPAPLQMGVVEGLNELGTDYYEMVARQYQCKRDLLCGALHKAGLVPFVPKGAYYVLADMSPVPGADSKEKAMHFLKETGIACVPGKAFYHDDAGESLARFCFAKEDHILEQACLRIERFHP